MSARGSAAEGADDQLLLLVATALAAIRLRTARRLATAEEVVSLPTKPDDVLYATRATGSRGGDDASSLRAGAVPASGDDAYASLAAFSGSRLELPALHAVGQTALEQCAAHLRAGPGWQPLLIADRVDAAVREVCRTAALRDSPLHGEPSAELVSLVLAAVRLLTSGSAPIDDNGYASMIACRHIVEACARHPPTALVAFELSIEAAGSIVGALERNLAEGHMLVLDDACARAQLASAHIFDALEGVAALLRASGRGPRSLAELPPTRQLLQLEQRIRDSEPPFAQAFPLVAGSITQCAWVAIGGADDERLASRAAGAETSDGRARMSDD